jgi:hypothetical protein
MKLIHVLPPTLAALLTLAAGCPPGDACPTGSVPTSDGRCVLGEPDAGADALTLDAAVLPSDAFAPDAFSPDAFLVIPDGCIPVEYWNDNDADGFGDMTMASIRACVPPSGYVTNNTDCNDACAACHPGRTEVCDARDNDCNGSVDEGVTTRFFRDQDTDGHGDASMAMTACAAPVGYVASSDDCDDRCAACFPGNPERCDMLDNNCSGAIDEGVQTTYYRDADADGHGLLSSPMSACALPSGHATTSDDCNDACASCFPGGTEVCDLTDNDCDASIDEGVQTTFYLDADGDGRGNALVSMAACTAPMRYVTSQDDCNDMCATCFPGRAEVCDMRDNDCNMLVDDRVGPIFYRDMDSDGHGLSTMPLQSCAMPAGYVASSDDCDDGAMSTYPGAPEQCNAVDDNCNVVRDETFTCIRNELQTCTTTCGTTGSRVCSATCTLPACTPPTETCNGMDDDCDTYADESLRAWVGPANAGVTTQRVELLATPTGYVRILSRATGIYAQAYNTSAVATGSEVFLGAAEQEFAAAVSGSTLHLATRNSGAITGRAFSLPAFALTATGTVFTSEFPGGLRLLANSSNVLVLYGDGTLRAVSRSATWTGSSAERSFGSDTGMDVVTESTSNALVVSSNGSSVETWRVPMSGGAPTLMYSWLFGGATQLLNPQVAVGRGSDGAMAVGVLVHVSPTTGAASVRFLMMKPNAAGTALVQNGSVILESVGAFGTTSPGTMDLTVAGGRFVGSWMVSSGLAWRVGDVQPIAGAPVGAMTSISLGTSTTTSPSTSIATVGSPSGAVLALHGRTLAPNLSRTWFRGCP